MHPVYNPQSVAILPADLPAKAGFFEKKQNKMAAERGATDLEPKKNDRIHWKVRRICTYSYFFKL